MAESQTAPTNKLVAFRGRAQKEFKRAYKHGLISDQAMRKAHKKFAKKAGHNPPKPEFSKPNGPPNIGTRELRRTIEETNRQMTPTCNLGPFGQEGREKERAAIESQELHELSGMRARGKQI